MAYTTIDKSTLHFNTKLWTGTGAENAITGIGFQPDWVWIKQRNTTRNHNVFDAVRGATKRVYPDLGVVEDTAAQVLKSFDSDGFTLGTDTSANQSSGTYVGWNWKANGQGSSNTSGTINSTYTSANTTSGFSIVKYTGNGSNGATVGHGLGAVPAMIAVKNLDGTDSWQVYHKNSNATPEDYILQFNTNGAAVDNNTMWNDTAPTSSVFSIGTDHGTNKSGDSYVAYCFAEKTGFSKFGLYTGNGNATNPPFIYTGFKPHWVLTKANAASESWQITDMARDDVVGGGNGTGARLIVNSDAAESTNATWAAVHKYSNGFSPQHNDGVTNMDGRTYVYMAFGQSLVGSNNVPCTAR